jgi:tetratricopeptide (TPR) repeat protein
MNAQFMPVKALLIGLALSVTPARDAAAQSQVDSGGVDLGTERSRTSKLDGALAAEFAAADRDFVRAATLYLQAASAEKRADYAERAVRFALAERDFPLAERAASVWMELAPKSLEARQALAFAQITQGNKAGAKGSIKQLLLMDDASAAGLVLGLFAAPDAGGLAVELLNEFQADAAFAKLPVERGLIPLALKLKQNELAKTLALDAVKREPNNPKAHQWLGLSHIALKDLAAAANAYQKTLELDPSDTRVRLSYAQILADAQRYDDIERVLAEAPETNEAIYQARVAYWIARYPNDKQKRSLNKGLKRLAKEVEADKTLDLTMRQLLLGQIFELRGDNKRALDWYGAVAKGESYPAARTRMAVIQSKTDMSKARAITQELQAQNEKQTQINGYLLEAEILREAKADPKNNEEAYKVLSRGIEQVPDSTELLYSRAMLAFDREDVAVLEGDLRAVLDLDPEHSQALNALGYGLLEKTQRYEEALELIQRANAIEPNSGAILDSLGWAQFKLERYDQAIVNLRAAYAREPEGEIAAHLGEALWQLGAEDEAKAAWQEGLSEFPDNEAILETVKRLKVSLPMSDKK